jgi:putative serine protease PepD
LFIRIRHSPGVPEPRSLWADPSAREPQRGWFERSPNPPVPSPDGDGEPPRGRPWGRIALVALLGFAALVAASFAGAALSGNDAKPAKSATSKAAGGLPAGRVTSLYNALSPGVVQIRSSAGTGTGFVVRDTGTIVTDLHVVQGGTKLRVIFDDPAHPITATLLGTDEASGLAAVSVNPADAPRLRPLPLGDSRAVKVGDPAVAMSYRPGLGRTVAAGIVAGLGTDILQTDAISDRGGPLVNPTGLVIGMLAQPDAKAAGTGLRPAIPSATIERVLPLIETGQTIAGAYLGVQAAAVPGGSGARVQSIVPGSPADVAGMQAAGSVGGGDTILGVETTQIATPDDLVKAIGAHQPGDVVALLVERDGQRFNLDVTLEARPQSGP